MRRVMVVWVIAAAVVLVVGTITTYVIVQHDASVSSQASPVPLQAEQVTRGDLVQKVDLAGTLQGSALPIPISAQVSGIVTWLPPIGSTVSRGQLLFRIDDVPTVLLYGSTPPWRSFSPGMSDGPDITELETNLLALGFGQSYGLVANGHYGSADEQAIAAFAESEGLGDTNATLTFGAVVFEPGPVLVVSATSPLGASVSAGSSTLQVEGTTPQVVAQVAASSGPGVAVGDQASITIGVSQAPLAATVSAVTSSPPAGATNSGSTGAAQASSGQSMYVTLTLTDPPSGLTLDGAAVDVQLQLAIASNVLIVPVTALVALVEGGYALQVDDGHGRTHLIPVTVGLIDSVDDLAEIAGPQVRQGLLVEVPIA